MTSEKGLKRDKNQNIQVFVRLRPLNQRERDIKSLGVVEVVNNREVVVRQSQQTSLTKKFTFDRAFAPHAKQVEVYQDVVSPLIDEVLAGYNCTVFAYGQTGTGKTHTMVGESSGVDTTWQNDPLAGIIPRALSQLFDELRITNTEYTVRVSYLELYNEELFDLLSTSEDNSKLRIYEDVTRKGSNIVNGLEEITVYNKNEVYKIMEQGQERKRVASTLMNAQSSRSHTVFTIVVHMKENSPEGEELVKIGKLNLVDLAGSENISKAGSDVPSKRERARECVNINQSLLTLGRVITALVERHPHIPYRESKLTRILQESLGGRTKTSIIATISPGHKDLEETMSTLEYAHRAKNIQNKPEINQKLTKKAILKEFVEEIDKLKRDLQAARDKNGVYLASDTFTEMTLKQEEQRKEIQELLLKKRAMEEERDRMEAIFKELSAALAATTDDLHCAKHSLQATRAQLADTDQMLSSTRSECSEQKHLVSVLCATERALGSQAQQLLAAADAAAGHAAGLHDAVDRRRALDKRQADQRAAYRHQAAQLRAHEAAAAALLTHDAAAQLDALTRTGDEYTTSTAGVCAQNIQELEELERYMRAAAEEVQSLISSKYEQLSLAAQEQGGELSRELDAHHRGLQGALAGLAGHVCVCVQQARQLDLLAGPAQAVALWHGTAAERVEALRRAHGVYCGERGAGRGARGAAGDSLRERRRARALRARGLLRHWLAETEKEKAFIEERTSKLFNGIETHRQETLERINSIEEQLARERQVLHRLGEEITDLEHEKKYLVEQVDARQEWMLAQLKVSEEEMEMADRDHEESEKEMQEGARIADEFDKEFEDGTSALAGQLAALAPSVQRAVEAGRALLLGQLDLAQACVQDGTSALVESDGQMVKRLADDNEALLTQLMATTKETLDTIHENVQSTENSARPKLQQLAGSAGSLMAAAQAQLASQREALGRLGALLARAAGGVCEAAHAHAQLEERCLGDQYPLYSPTGKTPQRVQYRYPRRLAATSPLARVLARRRAAREAPAEACVVLEDGPSDAESSTSEDHFAAPSPPAPPPPPQPQPLTKTVSETDIYSIKRQQERNGKENANHSLDRSSNKKPSKLPAPMSNKKPLLERNDNN